MRFKLLYSLFLTLSVVFGGLHVFGSIVVLYVVTILMTLVCFFEKVPFPRNTELKLYSIFVFIYSLSCVFHGYTLFWVSSMIGFYFVTYVWIWATFILNKKYNSVEPLIYILLFIGVANAIVTIGQHYMNPIALAIPEYLQKQGADSMDSIVGRMENGDFEFALWGIFDMVSNGYYSSVTTVLCVFLVSKFSKFVVLPIWLLFVTALFFVQERAALISGVFFSIVYYFYSINKRNELATHFLFLIIFMIPSFYLLENLNVESLAEGTRYVSFELGGRNRIFEKSFNYILDYPFTANLYDFFFKTGDYPHNLFYNAFIYGTIIGGIVILSSLAIIIYKSIKILHLSTNIRISNELAVLCFALFCYNVVSLTHNASIVSGDILFWLLATPIMNSSIQRK